MVFAAPGRRRPCRAAPATHALPPPLPPACRHCCSQPAPARSAWTTACPTSRRAHRATARNPAGPASASPWPPPTRWPPMRATRCCAPAARHWMRPSPCKWCWRWWSRSPAASAEAPSCCTRRAPRCRPTMGVRPLPPPPRNASSSTPRASPCRSATRWWAAAPWACPAPCACWSRRTRRMASWPGPRCSSRPSIWRNTASRSAPGCMRCCPTKSTWPATRRRAPISTTPRVRPGPWATR